MGEGGKRVLRVKFDGKLMLEFHGTKISKDAGSAIFHKVDKPIGFKYNSTIRMLFALFYFREPFHAGKVFHSTSFSGNDYVGDACGAGFCGFNA